jgi:hypothetical protein
MQSRDRKKKGDVVIPCAIHPAPLESFATLIAMGSLSAGDDPIFALI